MPMPSNRITTVLMERRYNSNGAHPGTATNLGRAKLPRLSHINSQRQSVQWVGRRCLLAIYRNCAAGYAVRGR